MKSILTGILSFFIFFGAVSTVNANYYQADACCEMACADEDIKKKKNKGKKSKKGFFSKIFGSK